MTEPDAIEAIVDQIKWHYRGAMETKTGTALVYDEAERILRALLDTGYTVAKAAVDYIMPQLEREVERLEALLADNDLATRVLELEKTLRFYADPESYFALFILPDRPAGMFADDFSDVEETDFTYNRPMPGALAREVLGIELPQQRDRPPYFG